MRLEEQLMLSGKLHFYEDEILDNKSSKAKDLIWKYNNLAPSQEDERQKILGELLGKKGECVYINPPFRCDYGEYIEIGDYFFANYDCIILDACKVKIGNHVFFGPRVSIYSASHPISASVRNEGYDISKPVTIGDNVWVGGNSVINPGVNIGDGTIIGSGSVVTKDIRSGVIAAGNPCKVIREITQEDEDNWNKLKEEYWNKKNEK